ncbi:MAG: ATP-dependent RecD-like DNA helicase [Candidatus Cloacimonetes bacterium]|nr:ATP-dependent RecD-like DNA helicase [Candidatus Cloacimonadota bacterium]
MRDTKQYEDEIIGILEHIVYRNEENGYSVVHIKPTDGFSKIVATGNLIGVNIGEKLIMKGNWILHPEYGQQFQILTYQVEQPVTKEGIAKFLSNGLIKGIGPKTALKIVQEFGEKSLDIIENSPQELEKIEGIGKAKRELIENGWIEQKGIKNVMLFLQKYNIKTYLALKIFRTYGEDSFQVLQNNPYKLTEDIYGVGFKTADQIARNLGIDKSADYRIQAGIKYILYQFSEEGHCFAKKEQLIKRTEELLDLNREFVAKELHLMLTKEILLTDKEAIYHPLFYHAERNAAIKIKEITNNNASQLGLFKNVEWQKVFAWLKNNKKIDYTPMQQQAIKACLTNKITVLTGGPGTGKSTITAALTSALQAKKLEFILAAPTGRAAKRLSEVTGFPAQTIHRLLEFSWQDGLKFRRNEGNPLDAAMIIVDETSMLDIIMLNYLLKAISRDTHLVFIGDVDQLPSVGAGFVLNDLIASGSLQVVRLDQIFRQHSESLIITNAHLIRQGLRPIFAKNNGDFFLFSTDDPSKTIEIVHQLVTEKIPQKFGFDPMSQTQVLAPMHKGEIGITELNKRLQAALNPYRDDEIELTIGERSYRIKDRVMQLRNNYDKEVFNGDLGIIAAIDKELQKVQISFDKRIVEYEFFELDQITHSYAISIHKSQGSEFPVVVIPLLMQHYIMLQRNLLYTAISRAKNLVVIVGSQQAIDTALRNNKIVQRNTMLKELLK